MRRWLGLVSFAAFALKAWGADPVASPDRVSLLSLGAGWAGGDAVVRWETGAELRLLSFDVRRRTPLGWVKLNASPVPASNQPNGDTYECAWPAAAGALGGMVRLEARLDSGAVVEVADAEIHDAGELPPVRTRLDRRVLAKASATADPGPQQPVRSKAAVDLTVPGPAVKIQTTATGMHFVSAASLGALLNQPAATVASWLTGGQVALASRGQPVTFIPAAGWVGPGQTGPGLFFYAELNRNNYTYTNVYWLKAGTNRWSATDAGNPAPGDPSSFYRAALSQEVDRLLITTLVSDPAQDYWMWAGLAAGNTNFDHWSTTFSLDHLAAVVEPPPMLTVRLFGGSLLAHEVQVRLNGTPIGVATWAGETNAVASWPVPAGVLLDSAAGQGANTLSLTAQLSAALPPGVDADQVYLNGFALEYNRSYVARLGALEAGVNSNSVVTVGGFTGTAAPPLLAFESGDPRRPALFTNVAVTAQGAGWQASLLPPNPAGEVALVQTSLRSSASFPSAPLSLVYPVGLSNPTNRAAYVVVTVPALADGAAQLAAYRQRDPQRPGVGLRTKVVLMEDVFNEFSDGLVTPQALADFLRTAATRWAGKPRYVCLAGNGSIDYRDVYGYGDNLLPPLLIGTPYGLFTSDSLLGDVDGAGRPAVAVGRLPLQTPSDFDAVLAKIEAYEADTPPAPLQAVLLADQPDSAGDFINFIQEMAAQLGPRFNSVQVHPDRAPAVVDGPAIQASLLAALNQGADLINYFGHGAVDRFGNGAAPYWLTSQTAPPALTPASTNSVRLPLVIAMTCVAGQYSSPGYTCLGKGLLLTPGSGAAGVIAPTGLSLDPEAVWLNLRLVQLLNLSQGGRIGDLMLQSFALYNDHGPWQTPVWIYNLLGDPAMKLARSAP